MRHHTLLAPLNYPTVALIAGVSTLSALAFAGTAFGITSSATPFLFALLCTFGGALLAISLCGHLLSRIIKSQRAEVASASAPRGSGWRALDSLLLDILQKLRTTAQDNTSISEKLASLESRHKVITDNIAAAVVLRDANHRILYCSPYTEVLTGYSTREILSHHGDFFASLVPQEDRERYDRAFKIGALGDAFQVRHRLVHSSGIEMWAETRTVPILDHQGELIQSLSVTIDVTGAVRYQRQVEEKNRDLHDFAYMVSHDLKGPMMTIKGMLGVLEEDLKSSLTPDASETLRHIRTATVRLEQLVAGVLEYSKISAQGEHTELVNLKSVLDEIRNHLAPQLAPIHATIKLDESYPQVIGEHVWLYQVFSNLLGNAIKFRDPDRSLNISVTQSPAPSGREVVVSVSDNGLGIPSDKVGNLFRPFQRAHSRSIEGTGIGLASVRRMLEKCGGSVRVESSEGVGSTFLVTLRTAR